MIARRRRARRAFTIAELLVVIAIIAVLGGITAVAVRGIAKDARISSAENTFTATLGSARALAMKNNWITAVVARPRWDPAAPDRPQFTELVTARFASPDFYTIGGQRYMLDRFVPVNGAPLRPLPAGIKVAGPQYDWGSDDDEWFTQSEFRAMQIEGEQAGRLIGILFDADGSVLTRNPRTDSVEFYVDFNRNGDQDVVESTVSDVNWSIYWGTDHPDDENSVNPVPFVAIYDDEAVRELREQDWSNDDEYEGELLGAGGLITRFGRRINFNRYTGVVVTARER